MYKKIMFAIFVFVLLSFQNVYGKQNVVMTHPDYATVVKVVEGDAMVVRLFTTGDYALVKLIGVDTKGYDDAYQYSNNRLMGKTVFVYLDSNIHSTIDRWNMVYMKENNELINSKLITMGYGMASISLFNTYVSSNFSALESQAKSDGVGMWNNKDSISDSTSTNNNNYYYDSNSVNINTASSAKLHEYLDSVTTDLAQNIVDYRRYGYFTKTSDVKYVDGFTKDLYDKNLQRMHVITNINKAKLNELSSLIQITDYEAQAIIDYRTKNGNITIDSLVTNGLMTTTQYNENKKFICDKDTTNNSDLIGNKADINIDSATILVNAGFTNSEAKKIVTYRNNGYTFKTIGELQYVRGLNINENELLRLKNNLSVKSASNSNGYLNINTASLEEFTNLGLKSSDAYTLFSSRGKIKDYTNMPIDATSYNNSITLYTNINAATSKELMSLDTNITSAIAGDIIAYTSSQPFGTMDEFHNYMSDKGYLDIYNNIVNFIVLY